VTPHHLSLFEQSLILLHIEGPSKKLKLDSVIGHLHPPNPRERRGACARANTHAHANKISENRKVFFGYASLICYSTSENKGKESTISIWK
jgi:hypothetical protein